MCKTLKKQVIVVIHFSRIFLYFDLHAGLTLDVSSYLDTYGFCKVIVVVVLDFFTIPRQFLPKGLDGNKFNCVVIPEWDLPIHPKSMECGSEYKDIFCFKLGEYEINQLNLLKPCICNFG